VRNNESLHHAQRLELAAEVLHLCGAVRLAAFGCSMTPAIFPGDVLTVRPASADEVQPGDVVLYRRGKRFFIHRLVRAEQASRGIMLMTQGDALREADPPFDANDLLGRVVLIERGNKRFVPNARRILESMVACLVRRFDLALRVVLAWHSFRMRRRAAQFTPTALRERS
jgi:signal peptidase I